MLFAGDPSPATAPMPVTVFREGRRRQPTGRAVIYLADQTPSLPVVTAVKVLAINGSPHKDGNTARLLGYVCSELELKGIQTEIMHIGGKPVHGCTACGKCFENRDMRCIIEKDDVNACIAAMAEADGIILGSPTYFADVSPELKALIDRAGFVAMANDYLFSRKAGAAVVAVRRAGGIHVFDTINHFFGISDMITIGSTYWNIGVGMDPGDVDNDEEGIRTMRRLGQNMAWVLEKLTKG